MPFSVQKSLTLDYLTMCKYSRHVYLLLYSQWYSITASSLSHKHTPLDLHSILKITKIYPEPQISNQEHHTT